MRSFDKLRMILRRFTAVMACCLVALTGLPNPALGSPAPAQFSDVDGSLALGHTQGGLVSRPVSVIKRQTLFADRSQYSERQSAVVNRQSSIANLQSPISNLNSAASCAGLNATTPSSWYATDNEGNVDTGTEVDNYPTSTVVIAPGFRYDCVAKDTDIVVMIYNQAFGTDPALVEKRTLQASPTPDIFYYVLTTPDGSPLQEGQWRVEFYQDKALISSGNILLGNTTDMDVTKQALVQGTVTDQRTEQPVPQARVFILNPGVTLEDFLKDTKREDVFVQTRTDADGQYSLWKPLDRNTQYAMLIAADGYKLRGTNKLIIGDDVTSPVTLTIQLVKR